MTRFHVHVGVADIDASVRFYATLFAAEPVLRRPDDAKWMLENPRVYRGNAPTIGGEDKAARSCGRGPAKAA